MIGKDRTDVIVAKFTVDNTFPTDIISPNFQVYELVRSDIATRLGINNWFRIDSQLQNAIMLARGVLQPVRTRFGKFTPNSLFRSQELERVMKGKSKTWRSKSQHASGQASDIEVIGHSNIKLAGWIRDNLDYDQLILEFFEPSNPSSGWVHVSLREFDNRRECLRYNGKQYLPGF